MTNEIWGSCPACGVGKMVLVCEPITRKVRVKDGEINREGELKEVTIEDEEFYRCDSCDEEIHTPEQITRSEQRAIELIA